eukprot:4835861-Amphidinium_carterae.1
MARIKQLHPFRLQHQKCAQDRPACSSTFHHKVKCAGGLAEAVLEMEQPAQQVQRLHLECAFCGHAFMAIFHKVSNALPPPFPPLPLPFASRPPFLSEPSG